LRDRGAGYRNRRGADAGALEKVTSFHSFLPES
jgi:hypothetical protein